MSTAPPLRFPLLLVVADRDYVADDTRWLKIVREVGTAALGQPVAIQVRAKRAAPDERRLLATRAREAVPRGVPLFLNGDAALAAELGYDGVHWPEAEVEAWAPADAPRSGPRWQSAAVHSIAAIRAAERAGADLVVFGSVFEPGSKQGDGVGIEALAAAVHVTALPVLAIGGITPGRVEACLAAGAQGVAVVSGVLGAPSSVRAMQAYLDARMAHAMSAAPADAGR